MANPQKEHGYVAIANDIYDAFRSIRISGEARQVLDCIIRQTYGYNKKTDRIALSQFCEWTGMKKPEVCRALAKLQMMKIVIGKKANHKNIATEYGLNKNYEEWILLAKKPTSIGKKANTKIKKPLRRIEVPLAILPPSKDIIQTNIQKTGEKALTQTATPRIITNTFFKGVQDLKDKIVSDEAEATKQFLKALSEKHNTVPKDKLWNEIVKFELYWTELNGSGTKQRWQKQDSFQVERRLVTWFGNIKDFEKKNTIKNNKYRVGSVQKKK